MVLCACTPQLIQDKSEHIAFPKRQYLIKSPDNVLFTKNDIKMAFDLMPSNVQRSILGHQEKFMQFSINQYISKQLHDYGIENNVKNNKKYQNELKLETRRLVEKYALQHYIDSQPVPDFTSLAHEHYLLNKIKYKLPEQVLVSHILIKIEDSQSEQKAFNISSDVMKRIDQGEDFSELAKEFSEGPSSAKGGDLGWVKRGQMVKPFEKAAFGLKKPGEVSDIIKTQYGFHIIKLQEKKPAIQQAFVDVKPSIIRDLKAKHERELKSQLFLKYDVSEDTIINQKAIDALYKKLRSELINK